MAVQRYQKISQVLSESELVFIEDALRKYEPDNLSEHGQDVLDDLKMVIYEARRWSHQFRKSEH